MTKRIVIAAGGTGGHVFPALAVAQVLQQQDWQVIWIGSPGRLEAAVVPAAGINFLPIDVSGLRGRRGIGLLLAPLMLVTALWQAFKHLWQVRPQVVLGMGGFASGPTGLAAWLLRIPLVIHEQNAVAGTTNRLLARLASRVCVAYEGVFDGAVCVGNPLRAGIEVAARQQRYEGPHKPLRVLVLGGSLGAQAINDWVVESLVAMPETDRPEVMHQTGKRHLEGVRQQYAANGLSATIFAFIDDMVAAYQWADVVIARAGALTVAEIAAMGVPSILIPLPTAIDDHQTANAQGLVKAGGAVMVHQHDLTTDMLAKWLDNWQKSPQVLTNMAKNARLIGCVSATNQLMAQVLMILGEKMR